jgi:hypothetical protein
MPDGLSLRVTALLVALAFGLTFAVQALMSGGSPAAKPAAEHRTAGATTDAQGAAPDVRLVAAGAVPALREPRRPKVHVRKPKRTAPRVVMAAPRSAPRPVTPVATPAPTAAPRYVPPVPRYIAPAPRPKPVAPKPKPAPTAAPPSGEFDTSGGG